jgi:hypothetical protein
VSYFKRDSACVDDPSGTAAASKAWRAGRVQKGARVGCDCMFGLQCDFAKDFSNR